MKRIFVPILSAAVLLAATASPAPVATTRPASSPTTGPVDHSLHAPSGQAHAVTGTVQLDAGYAVGQGVASVSAGVLAFGNAAALVANNGGNLIANNGGSLLSNNGGSVVSNNGGTLISEAGGALISEAGGAWRLLADQAPALGTLLPAAGMVLEVRDVDTGQPVALKLLRGELLAAAERNAVLARFGREAQIGLKLDHPNIVRVHDYGTMDAAQGGAPYLAMELIQGKELKQYHRTYATARPGVDKDGFMRYRASKHDCDRCALKPRCCPGQPARKIPRSIHEGARDLARDLALTEPIPPHVASGRRWRCCSPTSNASSNSIGSDYAGRMAPVMSSTSQPPPRI